MYVIFPGIALVIFIVFYRASQNELEIAEAKRKAVVAEQKAADEAKKQEAEQKAAADAKKHEQDRLADEAKAEADKQAKYEADLNRIKTDTTKTAASVTRYASHVSEMEIELDTLHKKKEAATRDEFETEKQVELAEIQRRTAELDSQRMVEMIAKKADASALTKGAPASPAPTS